MVHSRDSMLDVTKWRPVTAVEPHHSCCGWRKTGILDSLTSSLAEPSFQAEDRHSYGDALPLCPLCYTEPGYSSRTV